MFLTCIDTLSRNQVKYYVKNTLVSNQGGSLRPFVHGDQPGRYRGRLGLSELKEGHFPAGGGHSSSGREGDREAAVKKYRRSTSLTRKRNPLGPYRRPMPRVLRESGGGGGFSYAR